MVARAQPVTFLEFFSVILVVFRYWNLLIRFVLEVCNYIIFTRAQNKRPECMTIESTIHFLHTCTPFNPRNLDSIKDKQHFLILDL